ncbi:LacI family DNA-binding transcriptional regulator [Enterococcus sp. FDAARGOS_375]|uniref:LacI family DNA-binding transcriptional regulator n=1 Tax=Enterococcus TaxID=1350 RepID=UPI000BBD3E04|nr:LacI family DNA-binding transcriptional regulator [Enterococcus sp. FDAARGOS_375]ATF70692.1 LacI family transcriptional regulator [Enterococcus sp. FDAARGOS_375]
MVTIKDLAKVAGVSPTTVSNVLHGRVNKVSEETLEKVQSAIDEMNYVSNMGGRLLARRGSKIIGVIMTYARREENNATEFPFYSEIIGALEDTIRESGYYMMLYTSASIDESMKLAQAWDIEGLIVLGNTPDEAKLFYESSSVPVVFIDTYGSEIPNVGIDDKHSMKGLVEYLIDLGHKKIAFLSDSEVLIGVDEARFAGYCEAMLGNGLEAGEKSLFHLSFRDSIRRAMLKELYVNKFYGYTALCFSSDYYAVDAISFLSELGARIPEDISITGFDNNVLAKFSNPRLTTVNQNVSEKGTVAVTELVKMIKKGEKEIVERNLDTFIVEGQSTKFIF